MVSTQQPHDAAEDLKHDIKVLTAQTKELLETMVQQVGAITCLLHQVERLELRAKNLTREEPPR